MRIIFLVLIKLLFVSFCFSQKQNEVNYSIIKSTPIQNSFINKNYSNKKSATTCTYIPKEFKKNKTNQNLALSNLNQIATIDTLNVFDFKKTIPINRNNLNIKEKQSPFIQKLNQKNILKNNINYKIINNADSLNNVTSNFTRSNITNNIQNTQLVLIKHQAILIHKPKPLSINITNNN